MTVQDVRLRTITALMEANERRCGTIADATTKLHELMKAVRATGKGGSVTLKFSVAPDKNDELALTIDCVVSSTPPKSETKKALIYHDPETLSFSKTDPRQLELLAEKEQERAEREAELAERGIQQIGRGSVTATA